MPEPTATNPQTGEKVVFRGGQWVPMTAAPTAAPQAAPPAFIPGQVSPLKQAQERRAQEDQAREAERLNQSRDEQARQQAKFDQDRVDFANKQAQLATTGGIDASVEQGRAAAFALRAQRANAAFEGADLDPDSMIGATAAQSFPRLTAAFSADERNAQRSREKDFIAAVLRYESGAAIPPQEFTTAYQIYFPNENAGPEEIEAKRQARANAIEGLRLGAGPNVARIGEVPASSGQAGEEAENRWPGVVGEDGKPLPPDGGYGFDPKTGEWAMYGRTTDDSPAAPTEAERIANDPRFSEPDMALLARQGFTLGLSDEAAGVGGAIGNLLQFENPVQGYKLWRDVERAGLERARQNQGGLGTAVEIGSGFGGVGSGANALLTLGGAARQGAAVGGLGGFGYGEGAEGSSINALGGAALGASLGAGGQKLGNALGGLVTSRSLDQASRGQRAAALQQAGQAEGVNVNRAMADPALANKVTGVDASRVAGPKFQRGMSEIEEQIEGRVDALAGGRAAPSREAMGDVTQDALDRGRTVTGQQAGALYTRAEKLAGNAQVTPAKALAEIDNQLAELTAAGPNANSGLIKYLSDVKADLSRGGLSIPAIRAQRTSLRGQINERNLTHSDAERRMGMVLDAASQDITQALSGNPRALQAYQTADAAWRERSQFTKQIMAKLVGPEDNRLSAEATGRKIESWLKDDFGRFRRLWTSLEPAERDEIGAYVAGSLGRNNKGEFSLALFLSNTGGKNRTVSDRALRQMFGDDGFQSVQNLRTLATEANRVTGAMNSRKSGTAVGNDYRSWLSNLLIGGGGGAALDIATTGGATATTAALGAATAAGVKAVRDVLNARMLLSPKITKWALQAPRSQSPAAINRHFARLGDIAKAEPALAGDIEILRNAIMQAANDNAAPVTRSVAQEPEG